MSPERWKRIEELFEAAQEFSGEQREKFLEAQCAGDRALFNEVLRLIRLDEHAGQFLNSPLVQTASLREGEMVAQRYRIGPLLGRGGMGEVYRANDLFLREDVALKRLRPELIRDESVARQFQKEIQLARKITHPSVCRVFEAGEQHFGSAGSSRTLFFTMELLDGETLSSRIRREGRLPRDVAFSIAVQVAEGLAAAHQAGIVHTDFKSGNIILVPVKGKGERAVITDFGLARRDPTMLSPETTRTLYAGQVAGTIAYMSPEHLLGGTLTPASDIYSFGIVLFEMATGELPFDERLPIRSAMQRADPISVRTLVPNIHPFWEQTILRCLRKNPEDRFQSAVELAEWLQKGRWDWRFWSRREWMRAGLASAAVLAVGVGAWSWLRRPYRPQPAALVWYERGRKAMHSMTYETARRALEQAVSLDPMFSLAYANLARAYDELDYSDRASKLMLDAVAISQETRLSNRDQLELRALQFMVSRNYERAAPFLQQLEASADEQEKPSAALESGWLAQQMEDTEGAHKAYQRALQLDPSYAAGKLRLGFILGRIGENDEAALQRFSEAETLFGAASDYEGTTETLLQRANLLNRRSRADEAMTIVDRALGTARTVGNRYQEIRLKLIQGAVTRNLRQISRAAELAQQAVDEALAEDMNNLATSGLVDLGNVYMVALDLKKADETFMRALDLARRTKVRRGEVRAKAALISLCEQDHRPEQAKELAPDVLAFYRQAGYSRELAQVTGILAGVHAQSGDYDEGIRLSREGLDRALRLQDATNAARIRARLALNLAGSGSWPQALEEYVLVANDPKAGLAGSQSRLAAAQLCWWLGRHKEGADFIGEVEGTLVKEPNSQIRAALHAQKAEMAYDEGRWSDVLDLVRRGLSAPVREEDAEHNLRLFEALALIRSGNTAQGGLLAANLLDTLERDKLAGSLGFARLKIAGAWTATRNRTMALDLVSKALEFLEPRKITESIWRAHALAAQVLADSPEATAHREKARAGLEDLKTRWPKDSVTSYLSRPAVQQISREARL